MLHIFGTFCSTVVQTVVWKFVELYVCVMTLKIKALCSSVVSENIYQRRYVPANVHIALISV
jgi:hypothetical protein